MPEPSPAEAPALEATAASVVPGPATEHAAAPGRPGDDGAPVAPVGDRPAPAPALRDAQSEATTEDAQPMRRDPRPPEQSAAQGPHDVRPEQARQLDARGARITAEAADSPEPEVAPAPQGAQRPPVRATGSVRPAIVPEAASGAAASGPSPAVAAVQIGGARAGESSGAEAGGSRDGVPGAIRPSLTPGVAVSAAPMLLHGEFARQLATVAQAAAHRASVSAGEELAPQIVQALRMQVLQGGGEARVQLRPEHLGALTIDVRVENGRVSATFNAEVPAVRHWLESHESSLRQALSEQGLELSRFVVHEDGEAPSQEQQGQGESRRRQARRTRQGEEDATFEVIV